MSSTSLPPVTNTEPPPCLAIHPDKFQIDLVLHEEIFIEFSLHNLTDQLICFKTKTTDRDRYRLTPAQDYVQPNSSRTCKVVCTPFQSYPDPINNPKSVKDKFLVQSLIVGSEVGDLGKFWREREALHSAKEGKFAFSEQLIKCKLNVPLASSSSLATGTGSNRKNGAAGGTEDGRDDSVRDRDKSASGSKRERGKERDRERGSEKSKERNQGKGSGAGSSGLSSTPATADPALPRSKSGSTVPSPTGASNLTPSSTTFPSASSVALPASTTTSTIFITEITPSATLQTQSQTSAPNSTSNAPPSNLTITTNASHINSAGIPSNAATAAAIASNLAALSNIPIGFAPASNPSSLSSSSTSQPSAASVTSSSTSRSRPSVSSSSSNPNASLPTSVTSADFDSAELNSTLKKKDYDELMDFVVKLTVQMEREKADYALLKDKYTKARYTILQHQKKIEQLQRNQAQIAAAAAASVSANTAASPYTPSPTSNPASTVPSSSTSSSSSTTSVDSSSIASSLGVNESTDESSKNDSMLRNRAKGKAGEKQEGKTSGSGAAAVEEKKVETGGVNLQLYQILILIVVSIVLGRIFS